MDTYQYLKTKRNGTETLILGNMLNFIKSPLKVIDGSLACATHSMNRSVR